LEGSVLTYNDEDMLCNGAKACRVGKQGSCAFQMGEIVPIKACISPREMLVVRNRQLHPPTLPLRGGNCIMAGGGELDVTFSLLRGKTV